MSLHVSLLTISFFIPFREMSNTEAEVSFDDYQKELKLDVEWKWGEKYPMTIFLQGKPGENIEELGELREKLIILTVHDVGENPQSSFMPLAETRWMTSLRDHGACFLHICVPGQECGAEEFIGDFPSMGDLAESLPQVLDQIGIASKCIAIGEGAGADIVCRFAFLFPEMLEGLILVHPMTIPHGFFENLKEKFANLHMQMSDEAGQMTYGYDLLIAHKYDQDNKQRKQELMERIHQLGVNEQNLAKYLNSFTSRDDFTPMLKKLSVPVILLTGSKSSQNKNVFHTFGHMNKQLSSMLVAENTAEILREAPEYVAQAISRICEQHKHLANIVLKLWDEATETEDNAADEKEEEEKEEVEDKEEGEEP